MSLPGERIMAAELERSKRARTIAKNWLEAESTRLKLAGLDPELEGDGASDAIRSKSGRSSALARIKEARVSGLEIREFSKGLGDESPASSKSASPHVTPGDIAGAKGRIVEALAKGGKTATEIEEYLARVSPHLDIYALATNDPTSQALLYSRVMSGNGQGGLKDFVEAVKLANELRPQQPQGGDVGQIANAMATALKTGAELAKGNGNADPLSALNVVTPLLKEQTEIVKQSYEGQLALVREQLKNKDPEAELERIARYRDMMGWAQQESEQIQLHRLHSQDEASKRAYEIEKTRWEHELRSKDEAAKDRKQAETLKTIVGTVQKAFESPILKEFGRGVGRAIGADKNPVVQAASQAPAAAAQAQLQNPMEEKFSLTCSTCKRISYFSRSDLLKIEQSAGGKWVCSCGAAYGLKNSSSGTDDKNKDNEGSPIA